MALSSILSSSLNSLAVLPLCYLVYYLVRGVYRTTLHPLARFPGPKLAAFTRWYEVYYEVYQGGKFSEHIEGLHKIYGPIVRVNPFELHIDDPVFYDELYNFSPDIDRPKTTLDNLQFSPAFELHKIRRRPIEPYFSKQGVQKLESVVASAVHEMCNWLHEARRTKAPLDLSILARCFTSDVITEYIFATPYGFLQDPKKSEAFFAANNSIFQLVFTFRENRLVAMIFDLMQMIPPAYLPAGHVAHSLVPFKNTILERIGIAQQRSKKGEVTDAGHRVLFNDYDELELPDGDKSLKVRMDTAILYVGAGFETTAFTIETAMYHVLSNPDIKARLKDELAPVVSKSNNVQDVPRWTTLERLPYLTAIIYESLRLSIGVSSRLPRCNTKSDLRYKEWVIPKGQFVGMTQRDILYNADIFPEPRRFDPERWLKGEESKELFNKYLVTFSKGARRCVGMHLAYAELYLALATMFGQFDLELYETTRRNVEPKVDYFVPKPEKGAEGVRLLVK